MKKVMLAGMVAASVLAGNVSAGEVKWIDLSKKECTKMGGTPSKGGTCSADWETAVDICKNMKYELPKQKELISVMEACGGVLGAFWPNDRNAKYQNCYYNEKGFSDEVIYWSSTESTTRGKAFFLVFPTGMEDSQDKTEVSAFRCISRK